MAHDPDIPWENGNRVQSVDAYDALYAREDALLAKNKLAPDALDAARRAAVRATLDAARLEAVREFVNVLTDGEHDLERIGRYVVLYLYATYPAETQVELARRLGISTGRVSQELNVVRAKFAPFCSGFNGATRRTIKRRSHL